MQKGNDGLERKQQGKHRKQNRVFKAVSLIIVGVVVIFSVISMIVVKLVYDAQFPRFERDETVSADLRYEEVEETYPRRLVSFESGGDTLQGYVYGEDHDAGLVVVVHGLGGGADSYLPQITYFVDQGWRVFSYDATGSFDSEGETTKGFPQALIDLDAALTYIHAQPDFAGLPILLFGHSWGGYAVANVLHYDHAISGVVSVSGVNRPIDIVMEQGQRLMGSVVKTQYPFLWLYQRMLFGDAATLSAVDAVNRSDIPVLVIHGTADESVAYGGSSIVAHQDALTNPHVKILSISEPRRNGHNNLFRSYEALDYIDEVNVSYRELYDLYEQNIPYEVRQDFYLKVDRERAQDLNRELMDDIQAFLLDCVRRERL